MTHDSRDVPIPRICPRAPYVVLTPLDVPIPKICPRAPYDVLTPIHTKLDLRALDSCYQAYSFLLFSSSHHLPSAFALLDPLLNPPSTALPFVDIVRGAPYPYA